MKKVFFQGSFDILNAGHVRAIKRARGLGDYLVIALNTDELYKKYKNHLGVIIPFEQRKEILEGLKWVDEVIPISTFSPLRELQELDIDVYVLTKEWLKTKEKELAYMKEKGGQISWSPRYADIMCCTDIRRRIREREE